MNKFPILTMTVKAVLTTILWVVNKLLTIVYLCLPLWVFMMIMQLRDKNNKTTAISAFTEDNSEFQFIFENYILVAVKPNSFKLNLKRKITNINNFIEKWKWTILTSLLLLFSIVYCSLSLLH